MLLRARDAEWTKVLGVGNKILTPEQAALRIKGSAEMKPRELQVGFQVSDQEIESALVQIANIALKGNLRNCPGCGRRQGYIFHAEDVRAILKRLTSSEVKP
jgi:hypothetical protein